ncbi:hypothetical protein FOB64_006340 [Candida albicans]|uniref:DUF4246 domain-containing protein n=1 Tax=Candida albicans TaxID=5476 RepID=A0A8H6BVU8_CANAX|nr:hypothetical protein FOB64_006340 [Candida albicans]
MPVPIVTFISTDEYVDDDDEEEEEYDNLQDLERQRRAEWQRIGSPFKHPWWTAFTDSGPEPRCLDEWLTVEISNSIREKPDGKPSTRMKRLLLNGNKKLKNNVKTKPNI